MILDVSCNEYALMPLLKVFKNILDIIHIAGPVLAILSLGILSFKLVTDSSMKNREKYIKGIKNSLFALAALFFLPIFVNLVMYLVGDKFKVSECWNSVDTFTFSSKSEYKSRGFIDEDGDGVDDITGKSVQKVYVDPSDYERGSTGINPNKGYCPQFVEPNNTVKSSFDAETMGIIEQHLNDFDYITFNPSTAGKYIKSLGGVFSKYYGQDVQVTTAGELQEVAEYVFGLMYLYGFDYFNGTGKGGHYCKWGGSCLYYDDGNSYSSATSDAFYPGNMRNDGGGLSSPKNDFDKLITGANGVNMTTNCNWTVDMVYYKAGLFGGNGQPTSSASFRSLGRNYEVITKMEDLQVGDIVHFFNTSVDKSNPDSWPDSWYHVAFIGEVDKKNGTVTGYDGGSYYQQGRNFKWVSEIKSGKVYGTDNWTAVRITNLTQNCG